MPKAASTNEGVVYLIGNADNRLVKIGTTTKHRLERKSGIQTMSPSILTVLWSTPGGVELEDKLHYRFRAERRHGEWFDFGDRDPVSTVADAVDDIAHMEAIGDASWPSEPVFNAVRAYHRWLRTEASAAERNDVPMELAWVIDQMAALVSEICTGHGPTGDAAAAQAIASLQVAAQRVGGETYPDVAGMASPVGIAALAANMKWLAACMEGAIEDDPFALYSPQQVAEVLASTRRTLHHFAQIFALMRSSLLRAWQRNEIKRDGAVDQLIDGSDDLRATATALKQVGDRLQTHAYQGYVERDETSLASTIADELEARGLELQVRQELGRPAIYFDYQEMECRLAPSADGWVVSKDDYKSWLGAHSGAGHHPAQLANEALRRLDKRFGIIDGSRATDWPVYWSNPHAFDEGDGWVDESEEQYEAMRQRGAALMLRWLSERDPSRRRLLVTEAVDDAETS